MDNPLDRKEFAEELRITTVHGNMLASLIDRDGGQAPDPSSVVMNLLLETTLVLSALLHNPDDPEILEDAETMVRVCSRFLDA